MTAKTVKCRPPLADIREDDVQIGVAAHPVATPRVTRVAFRGWAVDLAGETLVIPTQAVPTGGSVADLQVCLTAARTLLAQRRSPSRARAGRVARSTVSDAAGSANVLVDVLSHARAIAAHMWHWQRFDVYDCVSDAWLGTGLLLPHRKVIEALHAVLPDSKSLMEFNLGATRDQICALFDSAIAAASRSGRGAA